MRAGIVINPEAGRSGARRAAARTRLARAALRRLAVEGDVRLTERPGSARALARSMIAAGATTIVAWGGDGTINEVAAEVAAAGAVLGVVPGGSGNGFARGLGLERRPEAALRTALRGAERRIDTGVIDGRIFVNVAGIGFDAHLAAVFNALPTRGAAAYLRAGWKELRDYRAATYEVRTSRATFETTAFLLAAANGREYGMGAVIAPRARPDDGMLDLVCVSARSPASLFWSLWRLFTGRLEGAPGVRHVPDSTIELAADRPVAFHVDGEVCSGGNRLTIRVNPSSLRLRVPAASLR